MTVEIVLLGSVEAKAGGERLTLGGPRQRRLLAYLALGRGVVRGTDGLVEAVWPDGDAPPDRVRRSRRTSRGYAAWSGPRSSWRVTVAIS